MGRVTSVLRTSEIAEFVSEPIDVSQVERNGSTGRYVDASQPAPENLEDRAWNGTLATVGLRHSDEPIGHTVAQGLRTRIYSGTKGRAEPSNPTRNPGPGGLGTPPGEVASGPQWPSGSTRDRRVPQGCLELATR